MDFYTPYDNYWSLWKYFDINNKQTIKNEEVFLKITLEQQV